MYFFINIVLFTISTNLIFSFPDGAPDRADVCRSMTPQHANTKPQTKPAPFKVFTDRENFKAGDTLKVVIAGNTLETIKGFMVQARLLEGKDRGEAIGTLRTSDVPSTTICTSTQGNGITHANGTASSRKSQIAFNWHAPQTSPGHVIFKATVVYDHNKYWVAEPSKVIIDQQAPPYIPPVEPTPPPTSDAISTDGCGRSKGCYRNPSGCSASDCDALVTWRDERDHVLFQMTADSDGWVAVGLSDDAKMGRDEVFECAFNKSKKKVEIRQSRNRDDRKDNVVVSSTLGFREAEGWVNDRRIWCTFKRDKVVRDQGKILSEKYHLLLTKGKVDQNGVKRMHSLDANKDPYVSSEMVRFSDNVDISGTYRYFLVKFHAVFMIFAWMICSTTALLLTKYYKPMWPNSRHCGRRVWLFWHGSLMLTCMVCTILGFILIFVHCGGYSQLPHYPDKAHPPLGITATILVILNPLIALCRPNDKSKFRPIFNWVHWLFGTAASVLAVVAMFIGLSLPKSRVPWWTTWIVAAFYLFHLIIELMLEIHGCLNGKKQKYRTEEWERNQSQNKQGSDLEPEPVGHRFKKRVFAIYLVVVIVLGLITIISVAAG